jgi:hypothetical protein
MPSRTLVVALTVVLALATATFVRADGDPASDNLLVGDVYFPYPGPSAAVAGRRQSNVEAAYAHDYRLKVAVIATVNDLGAVPSLFGKPTEYAAFLGQEIRFFYAGPLLIVMPTGFGIYDAGRPTPAEAKVLARLRIDATSADKLTASATVAVQALVAAGALKSKDITPPYIAMCAATGSRGQTVTLQFNVADDSKKATATLQILNAGRPVTTLRFRYRTAVLNRPRTARWLVPRSLKASLLKVCLTASDPSGNHAGKACAPLKIA